MFMVWHLVIRCYFSIYYAKDFVNVSYHTAAFIQAQCFTLRVNRLAFRSKLKVALCFAGI